MSTNFYELTFIVNPVLEDDEFSEVSGKHIDYISKNGGEVDEIDEWGIRKLEHEMNGKSSGYFVNVYFNAPGALIEKLERNLRIDDHVLRYLTLKYDAKMLRHREQQKKNAVPDIFAHEHDEEEE